MGTLEEVPEGQEEEPPPRVRPRPKRADPMEPSAGDGKEGTNDDPICWNYVTSNYCRNGDKCKYLHDFPEGYDVEAAAEVLVRKQRKTGKTGFDKKSAKEEE